MNPQSTGLTDPLYHDQLENMQLPIGRHSETLTFLAASIFWPRMSVTSCVAGFDFCHFSLCPLAALANWLQAWLINANHRFEARNWKLHSVVIPKRNNKSTATHPNDMPSVELHDATAAKNQSCQWLFHLYLSPREEDFQPNDPKRPAWNQVTATGGSLDVETLSQRPSVPWELNQLQHIKLFEAVLVWKQLARFLLGLLYPIEIDLPSTFD